MQKKIIAIRRVKQWLNRLLMRTAIPKIMMPIIAAKMLM